MSNNHSLRGAHIRSSLQPKARTVLRALLFPFTVFPRVTDDITLSSLGPFETTCTLLTQVWSLFDWKKETREKSMISRLQAQTLLEKTALLHRGTLTPLWKGGHSLHRLSSRRVVENVSHLRNGSSSVAHTLARQVACSCFCGDWRVVRASLPSLYLERPLKKKTVPVYFYSAPIPTPTRPLLRLVGSF